ncbi:MAG TPA: spore cortex biosynthesis protein YabQ [Bacillota bacterium]|nr:spore cortex biosynthesis protein YabQ [Bacillota bacterium]
MTSAIDQLRSFLISIGTGVAMGLLYDLVWLFRSRMRWKRIGTGMGDILFWVITTGLAFFLLLYANNGELRSFVYLGMCLGLCGYFWGLSTVWRKLIMTGTGLLLRLLALVWAAVLWPFRLVIRIILIPVALLSRGLYRVKRGINSLWHRVRRRISGLFKGLFRRTPPPEE